MVSEGHPDRASQDCPLRTKGEAVPHGLAGALAWLSRVPAAYLRVLKNRRKRELR